MGLSGIEARYPRHSRLQTVKYEKLARELDLVVTGGTDSHGSSPEENPIGSFKVDYEAVSSLKKARTRQEKKNKLILNSASQFNES